MPAALQVGPRTFTWGERTYLMGVVNLSPDSFSGDGLSAGSQLAQAVALAERMVDEGADMIDLGPESTRPGHDPLVPEVAWERLEPVLKALAGRLPVGISVDTYHAEVARQALDFGADAINDIHGLRFDPAMAGVVAASGKPCVLMHNQRGRDPGPVFPLLTAGLRESLRLAEQAGIPRERIILDPGFGFGWTVEENLEMLRDLRRLRALGQPLLIGTSRKSTIGKVLDLPVDDRLEGTAATVALAIANGADIVRVHDVRAMKRVAVMTDAVVRQVGS
jgi:dihydropteroate synthase